MVKNEGKPAYPLASLGLARPAWGFVRSDGTEVEEAPRGCPACNREEGRSSVSRDIAVELALERNDAGGRGTRVLARLAIDYCPRCGRIYDVRCSDERQ